ncbi:SagB/ThcOx family dehydrogenase [Nonomuraea insulae]|uniref:SagB family peptide dehydrogenase n=1 Tax=Nonomuraea insulae TaxID=1616787 RepID=A0ABW1D4A5_9ACTN
MTPGIALRPDAVVEHDGEHTTITQPFSTVTVRGLGPEIAALLAGLRDRPATVAELTGRLDSARAAALLRELLERLNHLLIHTLDPALRVVPVAREAAFAPFDLVSGDSVRLSGFAFARRCEAGLALESPLARHRVELGRDAVPLLAALARPVLVKEVPAEEVAYLAGAGMVEVARDGLFPEDGDPVLRMWDFHDLLFHSRSRLGRFDGESGATYRFLGELPPEPVTKPPPSGRVVDLPRPGRLEAGPPFGAVLESRRSVRAYGPPPTIADLGELLYRSARVKSLAEPTAAEPYASSVRPYPGGGAAYELELYLLVRRCDSLDGGLYHYDPLGHRLTELEHRPGEAEATLARARQAAGGVAPDVLIIITARFRRLSWKYAGMAYATLLKNVGVLYQTFYLVATAMGLAPCGLGNGDSDLSARLLGLDWAEESSVGEFLIGRP